MNEIWSTEEEAERLRRRFAAAKSQGIGQASFARDNAVPGGASMLSQHLSGNRPISLEAAAAYARGFGCSLAEISPRLAKSAAPFVERKSERGPLTPGAMELAALYDLIPVSDRVARATAYNIATTAILQVLQGQKPT